MKKLNKLKNTLTYNYKEANLLSKIYKKTLNNHSNNKEKTQDRWMLVDHIILGTILTSNDSQIKFQMMTSRRRPLKKV